MTLGGNGGISICIGAFGKVGLKMGGLGRGLVITD